MRFLKSLSLFAVAGVFAVASIACGDDDIEDNSSSGASGQSSGASGQSSGASGQSSGASGSSGTSSGGSNEFVQYVHDQIVNETKNNTPTDTLNDKTFTDSERSDLFDGPFFAGSYEQ